MRTKELKVDVAILGAGTAGLSALREVLKTKKKFVLIDPGPLGTTCARVGCMPSKVLLQTADEFDRRARFRELGIMGGEELKLDGAKVMAHVRKLRDYFVSGPKDFTTGLGSRLLREFAVFEAPGVLRAGAYKIRAKRVVLATGSHPVVPEEWLARSPLTSDDIFELKTLPKSLGVFGLGPLGAELGQAFARLGVKVHGFNLDRRVLGLTDPELNNLSTKLLEKDMKVTIGKAKIEAARSEKVLASLGRKPNVKGLGLDTIGVPLDERGVPLYNPRTLKVKGFEIYMAGDVRASAPVLHEASRAGRVAGRGACGKKASLKDEVRISICFTTPNAAAVGTRFDDLKTFKIGRVDFSDQGRARILGENAGRLHVYGAKRDGRLLGAEMICPGGEHLAHILALAITRNLTAKDLLRMPFYHPTLEEGLRTALRGLL